MITSSEQDCLKPGKVLYQSLSLAIFEVEIRDPEPVRLLVVQSPRLPETDRVRWESEVALFQKLGNAESVPSVRSSAAWGGRVWTTLAYVEGEPLIHALAKMGNRERLHEIASLGRQYAAFLAAARRGGCGVRWEQLLYQSLRAPDGKLYVLPSFLQEYLGQPPWSCKSHLLLPGETIRISTFCGFLQDVLQEFFGAAAARSAPLDRFARLLDRIASSGAPIEAAEKLLGDSAGPQEETDPGFLIELPLDAEAPDGVETGTRTAAGLRDR